MTGCVAHTRATHPATRRSQHNDGGGLRLASTFHSKGSPCSTASPRSQETSSTTRPTIRISRSQAQDLKGEIWKLERSQLFREPNDPSWQAFISGDWQGALALLKADRASVRAEARRNKHAGRRIRRVRAVEQPLSPYIQWELHALRILAEEGFEPSILPAADIATLERDGQLPEVVIIGTRVLYEVQYLPDWTPSGARRIRKPQVIQEATADISGLYARGEPLLDFFEREVAPLPKPTL